MQISNMKKPIGLFFYKKNIISIHYLNQTTTIDSNEKYQVKHHLKYVLDCLLMPYLNTLDGYIKAYHRRFNQKILIPIILNESCVLLPMYGYKNDDNIMLNIYEIKQFKSFEGKCVIVMSNDQVFEVIKACSMIKKHIEKARFNHMSIK